MAAIMSAFEKDGKKYPTIGLKNGETSKFSFTFGVNKAKMILDHVDAIKKFVEENHAAANQENDED